jgi:citrate synthase
MGRASVGEAIFLLLTGEMPTSTISRLIDAILVGFIDHGVTPSPTLATRHAATSRAGVGNAVAAGVLSFGQREGSDVALCLNMLEDGLDMAGSSLLFASAAADLAEHLVQRDRIPPPGFGHRGHTVDPRVTRLLQLAHELETDHLHTQYLRALELALSRHPALVDESLPINIDGAIAAVCGDLGLSASVAEGLAIVSRVPGLLAHAIEEQTRYPPMREIVVSSHRYDGPQLRHLKDRR